MTNLAPYAYAFVAQGQQGENGLDDHVTEVTMKMIPLPSELGTFPVSFLSFVSRDWMHLSSTRQGMFNMVNGSLIQQLLGQCDGITD
jgi:hypothetical protein